MSRPKNKRLCTRCHLKQTRAASGVCASCRGIPTVTMDGNTVHVDGLGSFTTHQALLLAHRIADAVGSHD